MQGALRLDWGRGWRITAPDPLPLQRLVAGRRRAEVVALLPRLFNLCGAAQAAAARLALDLPAEVGSATAIRQDILRDHLFKLMIDWPRLVGLTARALPVDWADDADAVRFAVFGSRGLPENSVELFAWLASGAGCAPLLSALSRRFVAGVAATDGPDNSPAGRQADHPALAAIAAAEGHGPLWRAFGRLVDLEAALSGDLPPPRRLAPGLAEAPASRGVFRIEARAEGDAVQALRRWTPTDDMLAGPLALALSRLPVEKRGLAPLVVQLFDPCVPVEFTEAAHA